MSEFNNHQESLVPSIETSSGSTTYKDNNIGLGHNTNMQNAKDSVVNNASTAADTIKNHPITQSVANGPVAQNVKAETEKTSTEFSNLAASRTTPSATAATGQQLTHYHSFFSSLLSWEHPRASGIAYFSIVFLIFGARYLDFIRYAFKLTYMVLGVTVVAEVAGQTIFGTGFTSQIRPKKYFTVSKEALNSLIGDVHELVNFFVIETQQIVFAENVFVSGAAFIAAFISYYLIKIVPFWGMSLISTSVLFLAPLIYKTNKQLIDDTLQKASSVINQQTVQVKNVATEHATRAAETTKSLVGDYSAKAQDLIGNARGRSNSPIASAKPAKPAKVESLNVKEDPVPAYKHDDFPTAPKDPLKAEIDNSFNPALGSDNVYKGPATIVKDDPLIAT